MRYNNTFNRGINRAISRNTKLLEIHCFYIIVKVRNVIKMIMFQLLIFFQHVKSRDITRILKSCDISAV
jgi:hypothetical protein